MGTAMPRLLAATGGLGLMAKGCSEEEGLQFASNTASEVQEPARPPSTLSPEKGGIFRAVEIRPIEHAVASIRLALSLLLFPHRPFLFRDRRRAPTITHTLPQSSTNICSFFNEVRG